MKYDYISKAILKAGFDLVQVRELQNVQMKNAMISLTQQMIISSFSNDAGVVSWSGDGHTVQSYANALYKEKCKRIGVAEAEARRAAEAEAHAARGADGMAL